MSHQYQPTGPDVVLSPADVTVQTDGQCFVISVASHTAQPLSSRSIYPGSFKAPHTALILLFMTEDRQHKASLTSMKSSLPLSHSAGQIEVCWDQAVC